MGLYNMTVLFFVTLSAVCAAARGRASNGDFGSRTGTVHPPNAGTRTSTAVTGKPSDTCSLAMALSYPPSPWTRKSQCKFRPAGILFHMALILINQSGDIEANPGPSCISCKEEVTSERDAICCDACDGWMHRDCAGIDTFSSQHSNCMWICPVCNNPNFSSVLFNSPITTSTDNRYSILADSLCSTIPDIRQLASSTTSLSPTRIVPSIDISDSIEPHIGRSADSVGSISLTDTLDLSTEYTPYPLANSTPEPIHASSPINLPYARSTKINNLKLLMLNCRSVKNKVPELEALIDTAQPDIVIGTESWLDVTIPSTEHLPTDRFNVFRNDRNGNGGGVFILVSKKFVCLPLVIPNNPCELTFAQVDLLGCPKLIVGAFYRPPASDQDYFDSFDKITRLLITSHPNVHFWIGGDFNLPDVSWTSNSVPPGAKDSFICKAAVQLAQDAALTQVVDQPTRGNNILDLFLTNMPSLVNRLESLPPLSAKADHNCVLLSISTKAFIASGAPVFSFGSSAPASKPSDTNDKPVNGGFKFGQGSSAATDFSSSIGFKFGQPSVAASVTVSKSNDTSNGLPSKSPEDVARTSTVGSVQSPVPSSSNSNSFQLATASASDLTFGTAAPSNGSAAKTNGTPATSSTTGVTASTTGLFQFDQTLSSTTLGSNGVKFGESASAPDTAKRLSEVLPSFGGFTEAASASRVKQTSSVGGFSFGQPVCVTPEVSQNDTTVPAKCGCQFGASTTTALSSTTSAPFTNPLTSSSDVKVGGFSFGGSTKTTATKSQSDNAAGGFSYGGITKTSETKPASGVGTVGGFSFGNAPQTSDTEASSDSAVGGFGGASKTSETKSASGVGTVGGFSFGNAPQTSDTEASSGSAVGGFGGATKTSETKSASGVSTVGGFSFGAGTKTSHGKTETGGFSFGASTKTSDAKSAADSGTFKFGRSSASGTLNSPMVISPGTPVVGGFSFSTGQTTTAAQAADPSKGENQSSLLSTNK